MDDCPVPHEEPIPEELTTECKSHADKQCFAAIVDASTDTQHSETGRSSTNDEAHSEKPNIDLNEEKDDDRADVAVVEDATTNAQHSETCRSPRTHEADSKSQTFNEEKPSC
jgi:hypothetical protein